MNKTTIIYPENGYVTSLNTLICQIGIQRAITEDFVALAVRAAIANGEDEVFYTETAISYLMEIPCELTDEAIKHFQTLVMALRVNLHHMFGELASTITFSGFHGNTFNLLLIGG